MGPWLMAAALLAAWGYFAYQATLYWRVLRAGAPEPRFDQIGRRLSLTVAYALAQLRMRRYPLAGAAHMLIFSGFVVLLLRSIMLWGQGFDPDFGLWVLGLDQPLGKLYGLVKDLFVVLVLLGALVFLYYRVIRRLPRLTLNREGLLILGIIITMMAADVLYDGATLVRRARGDGGAEAALRFHPWEPAGSAAQYALDALPTGGVIAAQHLGFWSHSFLVLLFLNLLPGSKHFHVITGIPNIFFQNLAPPGRLKPIEDIEGRLEREETLGVRRIDQFSWKAMLDLYTCTECGRCSDMCPATKTGKKLSPKHFTVDLRDFLYEHKERAALGRAGGNGHGRNSASPASDDPAEGWKQDLVDGVIDPEVLWACTTCRACEEECPVFISYVDKIVDMRRYLAQERGEFPSQLQTAFRGLESAANPYGAPPEERAKWAEGLDVPTLAERPEAEVLFWVGCAPAYDERAKRVTRATAELLKEAGVDFAILGQEEQCTGDPARRAGNEFLFQMFAKANVEMLNGYGADKKTVITTCPHCFNTLLNEYPDFGGRFRVVHHTTFLAELVRRGRLKPVHAVEKKVAYHDSCYLGRYNEVYEPPREVLRSIPGLTVLEPTATRDRGMCCGAGGAQMFKEEEPGKTKVNLLRTTQLLETRPDAVSSACPFCMRMLTDGLAVHHREEVEQVDVAEMLLRSVRGKG